jgi:amino-acid N-acetyltransferase
MARGELSMAADELLIERADAVEAAAIRDELRRIGRMMWEDLDPQRSRFWVCRCAGNRIAWVGLERDGVNALLRSLYTHPGYRKRGIGRRLVETAEREAAAVGIARVYLFSTGAGQFFQSLGYLEVPVSSAVTALRQTPQVRWYLARPELLAAEVTFSKPVGPKTPVPTAPRS